MPVSKTVEGNGPDGPERGGASRLVPTFAVALVLAATAATLLALLSYVALCDNDSTACPGGDPNPALTWQLVVAVTGAGATCATAWALTRGRRRAGLVLLAVALTLFAGWAVLLDLATHGGRFTLLTEALLVAGIGGFAAGVFGAQRRRKRKAGRRLDGHRPRG